MSKYTVAYLELESIQRESLADAKKAYWSEYTQAYYIGKAAGLGLAKASLYSLLSTEDRGIVDAEISKRNKEAQESEGSSAAGTPTGSAEIRWPNEAKTMERLLLGKPDAEVGTNPPHEAQACCPVASGDSNT